jgi:hypothetical protein
MRTAACSFWLKETNAFFSCEEWAIRSDLAPCQFVSQTACARQVSVGHVITQKSLAGSQGLETICMGHLRRCRRDFMEFSRVLLLMLRKYNVDLRVCGNGDNDTAIGIEVHDLRIAGRPDILS